MALPLKRVHFAPGTVSPQVKTRCLDRRMRTFTSLEANQFINNLQRYARVQNQIRLFTASEMEHLIKVCSRTPVRRKFFFSEAYRRKVVQSIQDLRSEGTCNDTLVSRIVFQ